MGALLEALEGGRDRGQARGEGECRAASFEIGDAAFECHARRVLGAGVVVALVHSRALLKVSRGGVDRHHDGAGRGVRFLTGVDAARREIELVCLCHSSLAIPVITGVSRRYTISHARAEAQSIRAFTPVFDGLWTRVKRL